MLEPRTSRPAWATQQGPVSKTKPKPSIWLNELLCDLASDYCIPHSSLLCTLTTHSPSYHRTFTHAFPFLFHDILFLLFAKPLPSSLV
jgi:hypothetical protein